MQKRITRKNLAEEVQLFYSLYLLFVISQVWAEERLNEANTKGTLLVLENLDPSFAASEVEVFH